jgi:hypothetical protein
MEIRVPQPDGGNVAAQIQSSLVTVAGAREVIGCGKRSAQVGPAIRVRGIATNGFDGQGHGLGNVGRGLHDRLKRENLRPLRFVQKSKRDGRTCCEPKT